MEKIAQVPIANTFFGRSGHFLSDLPGLGRLVSILLSNAIVVAGVVLLFLIIIGGINMISGAGSNNPQKVAQGKNIIAAAIIGFIIVVIAYWIVKIVGNLTGIEILEEQYSI